MALSQGFVLTKVVTVPMRIGGAAVSFVPVVGDVTDDKVNTTADLLEFVPI